METYVRQVEPQAVGVESSPSMALHLSQVYLTGLAAPRFRYSSGTRFPTRGFFIFPGTSLPTKPRRSGGQAGSSTVSWDCTLNEMPNGYNGMDEFRTTGPAALSEGVASDNRWVQLSGFVSLLTSVSRFLSRNRESTDKCVTIPLKNGLVNAAARSLTLSSSRAGSAALRATGRLTLILCPQCGRCERNCAAGTAGIS